MISGSSLIQVDSELLSQTLHPDKYAFPTSPAITGMITDEERRALACFAERIWDHGAPRNGLIIDGGSFVGASTVALADGLSRSSLPESERRGRIWSYDLFLATKAIAEHYLPGAGLKAGDSFKSIFEANISHYADYVRVHAGDIRKAKVPSEPIALLFLDILWSWDCTLFVERTFYPYLETNRSLLVHQDFVYPYYPWVILSMGLLNDHLRFAYNVQYSSVVFDVVKAIQPRDIEDPRNIPLPRALAIYDAFIDLLEGWAKGSVALGKALYLASLNQIAPALALTEEVALRFADEQLVTQYLPSIRGYCDAAVASGAPVPLDQAVGC